MAKSPENQLNELKKKVDYLNKWKLKQKSERQVEKYKRTKQDYYFLYQKLSETTPVEDLPFFDFKGKIEITPCPPQVWGSRIQKWIDLNNHLVDRLYSINRDTEAFENTYKKYLTIHKRLRSKKVEGIKKFDFIY